MAQVTITREIIRQWTASQVFQSWFNFLAQQVATEVLTDTASNDYIGTIDNERKRKIKVLLDRWMKFGITNDSELKALISSILQKLIGEDINPQDLDTTAYMTAGMNQIKLLLPQLAGVLPGDASISVDTQTERTLDYVSGDGAPAVAPAFIGQYYLDTTAETWYRSVSLTGWKLASAGSVINI